MAFLRELYIIHHVLCRERMLIFLSFHGRGLFPLLWPVCLHDKWPQKCWSEVASPDYPSQWTSLFCAHEVPLNSSFPSSLQKHKCTQGLAPFAHHLFLWCLLSWLLGVFLDGIPWKSRLGREQVSLLNVLEGTWTWHELIKGCESETEVFAWKVLVFSVSGGLKTTYWFRPLPLLQCLVYSHSDCSLHM